MQLLPLLLVSIFCLLVVEAHRDGWKDRPVSPIGKDRSRRRFGKLSPEAKERLAKKIGSLDARKARLSRMRKPRNLTPEQRAQLKERLAKLPKFRTQRPTENATIDLFELNMMEGIDEYMFEGDIDLTEEQANQLRGGSDRAKRQATAIYSKWANNNVYYYFDASVNDKKRSVVRDALELLQSRTCVNFIQSSTATNRIRVINDVGCWSQVGMFGGEQYLSMGNGCETLGTAAHEFMHALGFWHTQSRSDRDDYVTIDLTYVPVNKTHNFNKYSASETINYTPYEYGSLMHYGSNDFTGSDDKLSIIAKDVSYAFTMGNHEPSLYDFEMINKHYGCNACSASNSAKCKNGGIPNPRNCAVCVCPSGYAGTLCDQRPPGCGETLTATGNWQSKSFSYGDSNSDDSLRSKHSYCHYMINALAGQKIEIQLVSMWNEQCVNGCPFNGLEIKTTDTKITNPRYCCMESAGKTITSYTNPTPIIAYNNFYYTNFTFKYRAVPLSTTTPSTTTPPTTTKPSTTPPAPKRNCKSGNTAENCAKNLGPGFCNHPNYEFKVIKYNCAVECGLCGKAADPCVDTNPTCREDAAKGFCTINDPMVAEFLCAKSCGYCENPN